jgi:hypothetical protein
LENTVLYIFFFVLFAIFLIFIKSKQPKSQDSGYPYQQIGTLFTPAERSFYGVLCQATKGRAIVFGKVRVADILKTQSGLTAKVRQIAFNKISGKHFDFVLCHPDDLSIIATVELDDASHNSKKAMKRDEFLEAACKSADLQLHRFKAQKSYNIVDVEACLFPTQTFNSLSSAIPDDTVPFTDESSLENLKLEPENIKQLCPKCASDLIIRTAQKGDNKGNTFLACSGFPK